MVIIHRPQTNPYFNIAAEEYLLKKMDEDCFMLWQNEPSVIVGKHQNTFAEINLSLVLSQNIPVVRRISGGGTVVHDPGNLNFSFIKTGEREKLVDFREFTQPIIDFLDHMGVPAQFEGKNDLRVNGLKISGNAEHVFKNKVMHHGTLLFSSDLSQLNSFIKVDTEKYTDKSVKSIRSKVANIVDFLPEPIAINVFKERIIQFIIDKFPNSTEYFFTQNDIEQIQELVKSKYETWQWNYGYSPRFISKANIETEKEPVGVEITIEKGMIKKIESKAPFLQLHLNHILVDCTFDPQELRVRLQDTLRIHGMTGLQIEKFVSQLFN